MTKFEKWMCWWMKRMSLSCWVCFILVLVELILEYFMKRLVLPFIVISAPILIWFTIFFINLIIYGIKCNTELNKRHNKY